MRFLKVILFIYLLSFFYGVNAGYKYPYVCSKGAYCYSTELKDLEKRDYYLMDDDINYIPDLSLYIDNKLNEYIDYYGESKIIIKDFYNGTGAIENKELTLEELIAIGESFETSYNNYSNGQDFLYTNFGNIINKLHDGFPMGDKKNQLSDILVNIVGYEKTKKGFYIKNICNDKKCHKSEYGLIGVKSNMPHYFLNGEVRYSDNFVSDNFKVSNDYSVSSLNLKAGESLDFDFGFEDYLDFDSLETEYEYEIFYNYEGGELRKLLEEKIKIDKNYEISSDTIEAEVLNEMLDLKVLNEDLKKFRLGIKEGLNLTKTGKIYFYLGVENLTSGEKFDAKRINTSPVIVEHSDEIGSGESEILNFSKEGNLKGYKKDQTFQVKFNLKDNFQNEHYDDIDGYEISLSDGSSEFIELSQWGTGEYSKKIFVKSENGQAGYYNIFQFKIIKDGFHDLIGFDIKARKKETSSSYIEPSDYTTFENLIPGNLYDSLEQKMKIHIPPAVKNEFDISCTKEEINLFAICNSDDFSGCNNEKTEDNFIKFTKESENNSSGTLLIKDHAYNTMPYNYIMNHIDQTAPTIELQTNFLPSSGIKPKIIKETIKIPMPADPFSNKLIFIEQVIERKVYNSKATDNDLILKLSEKTTSNCDAEIKYKVKENGEIIYSGSTNEPNYTLKIENFFKEAGERKIFVEVEDKYKNVNKEYVTFNVYPDKPNASESTLEILDGDNKYANNSDYINYKIILKDQFGNPIYDKKIFSIEQDCTNATSCETIKTKGVTGEDALVLDYEDKETDKNGVINFKLKSLAPGYFTSRFKIKMNNWGNDYVDNEEELEFTDSNSTIKEFKKPIIGELKIVEGGEKPEIGKQQEYQISLINTGALNGYSNGYSNGSLDINKDSIDLSTNGHIWRSFEIIEKNFGSDIDTKMGFSGSIDSEGDPLSKIEISLKDLDINYKLGGEEISYNLDDFGISGCDISTLGLKVTGSIQGGGKSELTGQESNFSDLSKSVLRSEIRKNAFSLIKGLKSEDNVNGVKYIEGNITISGNDLGYETLIVKNGNVFILGDLNIDDKKLGIIVLKDNYNVLSDYNNSGNIYVSKDVENINAIIYADGTFRSAKSDGSNYTDSKLSENKLKLKGSLFTKNTIGGAVKGVSGYYILPGGKTITDYYLAEKYDLNYIRKVSTCGDDYSFLIEYNPSIQTNPPKGFSQ